MGVPVWTGRAGSIAEMVVRARLRMNGDLPQVTDASAGP